MAATAALIAVNWSLYVWAVINGHVVESSLGYYINPLVNWLWLGGLVFVIGTLVAAWPDAGEERRRAPAGITVRA